jgi:O-antigen/teichoic acid export membrane protein
LSFAGRGIPIAVGVATIPIVLRGLGTERFGILTLVWAVYVYFGSYDIGLGRATTRFVATSMGHGEPQAIRQILWTAVLVQATLGVGIVALVLLVTPVLVETGFSLAGEQAAEARASFYMAGAAIPVLLVAASLRGALEGVQRFDVANATRAGVNSGNFLLPAVGVISGLGLKAIGLLLLGGQIIGLLVTLGLCVRVLPLGRAQPVHHAPLRPMLTYGAWLSLSGMAAAALVYLDRFLVAFLLSVGSVAYYAAPYELISRLLIVPASIGAAIFPVVSTLHGQRKDKEAEGLLIQSVTWIVLLLAPILLTVVLAARDILVLWIGSAFAERAYVVLQALSVGMLATSLAQVPYTFLQARGRPDLPAKFYLLELPLYVALSWSLIRVGGITGAAIAWSVRATVDAILLSVWMARLGSYSLVALMGRMKRALAPLVGTVIIGFTINTFLPSPLFRVTAMVLMLVAVYLIARRFSTSSDMRDSPSTGVGWSGYSPYR